MSWWPRIELTYSRGQAMRNMFTAAVNRLAGAAPWPAKARVGVL